MAGVEGGGKPQIEMTPFVHALAGGVGGMIALLSTYPLDIIKTRLQVSLPPFLPPSLPLSLSLCLSHTHTRLRLLLALSTLLSFLII